MNTIYHCFPGGKHKALTFSYDDGKIFDRRLVEIFNKNGLKGTFNLNSGIMPQDENRIQPEEVESLYQGHEVACHTYTHPTIARCPAPGVVQQVLTDRQLLEDMCGYPVEGLAYPNGSFSPEIVSLLPFAGIKYARTVTSTMGFQMPDNFLAWNPTCHHKRNLKDLGEQFNALFKTQYLYLMYVWGHSYEFDGDSNWELIEDFCKMMAGKDDIWYATNIDIVRDEDAFRRLIFTSDLKYVYNPSFQSVWLSVNNAIVEAKGGAYTAL
ncbi:MAG: polysaccharide deacetylase family protein [Clostridia bacterium]|nr:polysaccharide deacetylase family protein [Clostridia bacterium]